MNLENLIMMEDLLQLQRHNVAGVVVNLVNLMIRNDHWVRTSRGPAEVVLEVIEVGVNLENSMNPKDHWVHHHTNHREVIHHPKNKDIQ